MAIYLDYNATAPLRPDVMACVSELLSLPLNASSVHASGRLAKKYLENARKTIAESISAFPGEIIFTASGSEANNLALRGFADRRILVSAIEHSSVLKVASCQLPVASEGIIDLGILEKELTIGSPALVSIMLANNETGVIQPIQEIAAICKKYGALLHTDAVQALGKIPVDFSLLGADMMTLSAHKMGGPVGAACLVVKQNLPIQPLIKGGGQELNRRAGTENIAAIAGFAKAAELMDFTQMAKLRGWLDYMEKEMSILYLGERGGASRGEGFSGSAQASDSPHPNLLPEGEGIIVGSSSTRLPNTSCIAMPDVSSEVQLMNFDLEGFAVSAGSACSSGRIEPSHVLSAMGTDKKMASCAIRISGGWNTTENDIISFTKAWKNLYKRLSKNS